MSEMSDQLMVEVSRPLDVGLHFVGTVACAVAAYHTGQTGEWVPLLVAAMATALVVLFVTSE